jgi:hypothetical protein
MPQASRSRQGDGTRDWRDVVATASGINFVLGIWLITAPYVLGYEHGEPYWNDIVFGAVIALLAFVRATRAMTEPLLSYLNIVAGTWVFAAAFWLYGSGLPAWNDLLVGAAVAILATFSVTASEEPDAVERVWYRR